MSEELKPEVTPVAPDVEEKPVEAVEKQVETVAEPAAEPVEAPAAEPAAEPVEAPAAEPAAEAAEKPAEPADFAGKTLAELSDLFEKLAESVDRMKRSKEAEAIKSAFYRKLSREKFLSGLGAAVDEPSDSEEPEAIAAEPAVAPTETPVAESAEAPATEPAEASAVAGPFAAIEAGFKALYTKYKKERAEYNRAIDAEREDNLRKKEEVIEDLRKIVEAQEDLKDAFPAFREIQARWREIGPVPQRSYMDVNNRYQFLVERFYDMVKIDRDLRDLDFKKNLEAKEKFCEEAETLAASEDSVGAFNALQRLHEEWKEYGPVAKEFRESIWERFRAATAVINRKYQAHFIEIKTRQADNLAAKTALCEKVEAIAAAEIGSTAEWTEKTKAIEEIQQEWRGIGFASRKDNQKIYDRFRAACDAFFARKREYYSESKENMNENLRKKLSIIEQAEALKDSKEWKKTTEALKELQKQWKEIGAVPRKKSEQLWKRFRAACDAFFEGRDAESPVNDQRANLKAKKALIAELEAYVPQEGVSEEEAMASFTERWSAIGFVPFKEKEAVQNAWHEALRAKFPDLSRRPSRPAGRGAQAPRGPRTEKDRLVQRYNALQQDIQTYENNIGFFSSSKNAEPLIRQMQEKIDASKAELESLKLQIREIEKAEAAE